MRVKGCQKHDVVIQAKLEFMKRIIISSNQMKNENLRAEKNRESPNKTLFLERRTYYVLLPVMALMLYTSTICRVIIHFLNVHVNLGNLNLFQNSD